MKVKQNTLLLLVCPVWKVATMAERFSPLPQFKIIIEHKGE